MTDQDASWHRLNQQIIACRRCPRLIEYCRAVAEQKRKAFREWEYWGRPVPNFGDARAQLLIVGLAPAAHGANRTGRMFTGDRSGEWLYRALHRAGFATQSESHDRDDGLRLISCAITAICHCAPPQNKPTAEEQAACLTWLQATMDLIPFRAILCLGGLAWNQVSRELAHRGLITGRRPKFAHGATCLLDGGRALVGSYHPSQQNTFTGRLTEQMLDDVFVRARELLV